MNTDSFENIFEKNLKIEIKVKNYELCKGLDDCIIASLNVKFFLEPN
jgi:hypothetical protein